MSSVVDFLEKMGSDAQWRDATKDEIEQALIAAKVDAALRAAILANNTTAVRQLMGQPLKATNYLTPTPHEIPKPIPTPAPAPAPAPEPDEKEDEEESSDKGTRPSSGPGSTPSVSLRRSS